MVRRFFSSLRRRNLFATCGPVSDDGHDAFQLLDVHVATQIRIENGRAVGDGRQFAAAETELVHFFQQQFGIRDHRRQQYQNIRPRGAHFLDQRRGIGQRRGEGFVHHQLQARVFRTDGRASV